MTRWVAFVSVVVGVGTSQRISLSVLARFPTRPEEDEGKKVPERQKKAANRRGQDRERGRTEKLTGKRTVNRDQRKATALAC